MINPREQVATLFEVGVQTQAVGMAIAMLLEALEENGIEVRPAFVGKLTRSIDALDDNAALDPSEGAVGGALRLLLLYAKAS